MKYSQVLLIGLILIASQLYILNIKNNENEDTLLQSGLQLNEQQMVLQFFKLSQQYKKPNYQDNFAFRYEIFKENLYKVQSNNKRIKQTFTMKLNKFFDVSSDEFAELYLESQMNKQQISEVIENQEQNIDINWLRDGAVTEVQDQFRCKSGYAFSATGNLEAIYQINNKMLVQMSPQEIIDCSQNSGNLGCNGGLMDFSFQYVIKNGISTLKDYPYTGRVGICKSGVQNKRFLKDFAYVESGNCTSMIEILKKQPISIGVDASNWQFYDTGIFSNCKKELNTGVLLVGATDNYWLIKNSWGQDWGEQGYIKVLKGDTCGICQMGSYGIYGSS